MTNLFREARRGPLVAPSILSADFASMGDDCRAVLNTASGGTGGDTGAELLHLDVMDGHFVPNLTMGPDMCKGLRKAFPNAMLDVHLMVTDPMQYVDSFAAAGADHFTFHVEPAIGIYRSKGKVEGPSRYDPAEVIAAIHEKGMTAGLAINPPTEPDSLSPWLDQVEMVLVMSVNPGYSGQKFIEMSLDTTRAVRRFLRDDQFIQMDGGIGPANASAVKEAGCDVLVAASAIFGKPESERIGAINSIRDA
jgi:ribulose-phosphate 3-epimerase